MLKIQGIYNIKKTFLNVGKPVIRNVDHKEEKEQGNQKRWWNNEKEIVARISKKGIQNALKIMKNGAYYKKIRRILNQKIIKERIQRYIGIRE